MLQDLIKSSLTDLGCCKLPLLVVAFLTYWRMVHTTVVLVLTVEEFY